MARSSSSTSTTLTASQASVVLPAQPKPCDVLMWLRFSTTFTTLSTPNTTAKISSRCSDVTTVGGEWLAATAGLLSDPFSVVLEAEGAGEREVKMRKMR